MAMRLLKAAVLALPIASLVAGLSSPSFAEVTAELTACIDKCAKQHNACNAACPKPGEGPCYEKCKTEYEACDNKCYKTKRVRRLR
jgi:hypothetical protein